MLKIFPLARNFYLPFLNQCQHYKHITYRQSAQLYRYAQAERFGISAGHISSLCQESRVHDSRKKARHSPSIDHYSSGPDVLLERSHSHGTTDVPITLYGSNKYSERSTKFFSNLATSQYPQHGFVAIFETQAYVTLEVCMT
ncbi:hypothetical protein BST61_g3820 [Cercospora zeina]